MTNEATQQATDPNVLETAEVAVPPRRAEAHQGEITGVGLYESDNGGVALEFTLLSLNTGTDDTVRAFLPQDFVEHLNNGGTPASFDPSELVDDEEQGVFQLSSYRRTIANSDHDAMLQKLTALAVAQGRGDVLNGAAAPTSIEAFVELYSKLLSGTKIIYRKKEKKNDQGQKFFNVTGYFNAPEDADNPKAFRNVRKMWMEQ